jgi:hypothetical protein
LAEDDHRIRLGPDGAGFVHDGDFAIVGTLFFGELWAYSNLLFLGLPIYFWVKRRYGVSGNTCVAGAAFAAALPIWVLYLFTFFENSLSRMSSTSTWLSFFASSVGATLFCGFRKYCRIGILEIENINIVPPRRRHLSHEIFMERGGPVQSGDGAS